MDSMLGILPQRHPPPPPPKQAGVPPVERGNSNAVSKRNAIDSFESWCVPKTHLQHLSFPQSEWTPDTVAILRVEVCFFHSRRNVNSPGNDITFQANSFFQLCPSFECPEIKNSTFLLPDEGCSRTLAASFNPGLHILEDIALDRFSPQRRQIISDLGNIMKKLGHSLDEAAESPSDYQWRPVVQQVLPSRTVYGSLFLHVTKQLPLCLPYLLTRNISLH